MVKDLKIGDIYFYKTSSIVYFVKDKYYEKNKLCVDVISDDDTYWKLKSKRDLSHEIILLSDNPTEIPDYLNENEITSYLISNGNAYEILCIYWQELGKDYKNTTEQLVYENCPSIRLKDFKHFTGLNRSDAAHIEFNDKAMPIDVIALDLSETINRYVDEETIIYTLLSYPKGYSYNVLKPIADSFKALTNVSIYRFVKRIKIVQQRVKEQIDCPF